MTNTTSQLTNTEIKQAKPRDKEYNLLDGGGLALRIKPTGHKAWLFNYSRPYTKKRTNMGLGVYPDVSLASARIHRHQARELLSQGIDPQDHRAEFEQSSKAAIENTFAKLAEKWIELKQQQLKEVTVLKAIKLLRKYLLPSFGEIPIQNIKPKIVIEALQPLSDRGKHETVKQLCRYINEILRLAVASGIIEINYLADITKLFPSQKVQHMLTIEPKRLPDLMTALSNASITIQTTNLFLWQLHTMSRPIEAASTRWADIDFNKNLWVIPAERMKMNKAHTVPLTTQTLEILEIMKPLSEHRVHVFPGQKNPNSHMNSSSVNMAIKRMGFKGKLVSHGLRSIASTALNEQSFNPDVIEAALAHVDKNEVRRAYNRSEYLEQRRKLMCWWSDYITQAETGNTSLTRSKKNLRIVN